MPDPVILTRPRAQAELLAHRLTAAGRRVELLPLLDIEPLEDQSTLAAVLRKLGDYDMVAFVSPNAIDAALAHVRQWPEGVAIAVLGEGSKAALARHGVTDANATIYSPKDPERSDSESLLTSIDLKALRGKRILIVRGEAGRELMADGLRAAAAEVVTVAAYKRSVPAMSPQMDATLRRLLATPHTWVITSSEAMRGLAALVAQLGSNELVAKMQQQQFLVPHARIEQTALDLGLTRVRLTAAGDEGIFAALQSRL